MYWGPCTGPRMLFLPYACGASAAAANPTVYRSPANPPYDAGLPPSSLPLSRLRGPCRPAECDVLLCEYWKARYGVVPYSSWGSMPGHLWPAWDYGRPSRGGQNCNTLFAGEHGLHGDQGPGPP